LHHDETSDQEVHHEAETDEEPHRLVAHEDEAETDEEDLDENLELNLNLIRKLSISDE
jgi:hypothetical protein